MTITNTTGYYVNADGLLVKFPQAEVVLGKGGSYEDMVGSSWTVEFDLSYLDFVGSGDQTHVTILDYDIIIPDGAMITNATFFVGATAWDSASSDVTLDFGLVARGTSSTSFTTITDADGLVAALAKSTIDTVGAIVPIYREGSATYAGALLGTVIAADSVVCCNWNGHVPSQGTGRLRLTYSRPSA